MTRPFISQPLLLTAVAQADPQPTSWLRQNSGRYSRVSPTAKRTSGISTSR
ncbi:MAG: hypothetical protein ABI162_17845 [Luteolibacter sp.]